MTSSTNQFLKPVSTLVNEKGNLEIGGCDLVDLAEKYGTPLYVIDENHFVQSAKIIKSI